MENEAIRLAFRRPSGPFQPFGLSEWPHQNGESTKSAQVSGAGAPLHTLSPSLSLALPASLEQAKKEKAGLLNVPPNIPFGPRFDEFPFRNFSSFRILRYRKDKHGHIDEEPICCHSHEDDGDDDER